MKKNKTIFVFSTIVVATVLLLVQINVTGQSSETDLINQEIEVNLSKATLVEVLSTLAVHHRVPVGLEEATDSRQRVDERMYVENGKIKFKEGKITIKSGSLKEILDSLIEQEPQYTWEVRDGVINIFPVQLRDEFLKKFLETKIEKFSPLTGWNKFQLRDAIVELPEVKTLLKAENVEALNRYYQIRESIYEDKEIELSISNTDVRGILNKVARDSEYKIWVIERIGERREDLLVSF